jgi:D-alanine-D-alanine ligase
MKRILLLLGGESGEREVSLASGRACAKALLDLDFELLILDPALRKRACSFAEFSFGEGPTHMEPEGQTLSTGLLEHLLAELKRLQPALVFNCLHGGFGEDGRLAALLEMMQIAQTASASAGSALAMDKMQSKRIMQSLGVPTPQVLCLPQKAGKNEEQQLSDFLQGQTWPLIVKPNAMGSSLSIRLVDQRKDLDEAMSQVRALGDQVLLEQFIEGRELTVGQLGDRLLPVIEILPREGWYDYSNKYSGSSDYRCPAELDTKTHKLLHRYTALLTQALNLSGVTRTDFRMDAKGAIYCLEVNTTPGMTDLSLLPMAAKEVGLNFKGLVSAICDLALSR